MLKVMLVSGRCVFFGVFMLSMWVWVVVRNR